MLENLMVKFEQTPENKQTYLTEARVKHVVPRQKISRTGVLLSGYRQNLPPRF